jgi:hypothetical protein
MDIVYVVAVTRDCFILTSFPLCFIGAFVFRLTCRSDKLLPRTLESEGEETTADKQLHVSLLLRTYTP